MERDSVTVNGVEVMFCNKMTMTKHFIDQRKRVNSNNGKGKDMDTCPFCNKIVQEGDEVYLVLNNYKLFPNVFGHAKCVEIADDELISKCKELTNDYQKYLDKKKIWG